MGEWFEAGKDPLKAPLTYKRVPKLNAGDILIIDLADNDPMHLETLAKQIEGSLKREIERGVIIIFNTNRRWSVRYATDDDLEGIGLVSITSPRLMEYMTQSLEKMRGRVQ